jgi:hypothetical protein
MKSIVHWDVLYSWLSAVFGHFLSNVIYDCHSVIVFLLVQLSRHFGMSRTCDRIPLTERPSHPLSPPFMFSLTLGSVLVCMASLRSFEPNDNSSKTTNDDCGFET